MVAFDYERPAGTAERMIERYGQAATLRRTANSGPAHNPTQTSTDYAVTVVVTDYANSEVDGTRVLATDKKALMARAALEIEPNVTTDKLIVGGVAHSLMRVETLAPGGVTILWTLQCRR